MKIRQLFAAAAVAVGSVVTAANRVRRGTAPKPVFGFSTLKAATPEVAKAKAEAWLKSVGKYDQAAFGRSGPTRAARCSTAPPTRWPLGSTEAAALLENARKVDAPAPTEVPAVLKDDKQDPFFRTNVALAFAKAAANKRVYEEALDARAG